MLPLMGPVRGLFAIVVLLGVSDIAAAHDVPLPRARPATLLERFAAAPRDPAGPVSLATAFAPAPELQDLGQPQPTPEPSACALRLSEIAAFTALPALIGPGECGAVDVVRLEAVLMPDAARVTLNPPPTLR